MSKVCAATVQSTGKPCKYKPVPGELFCKMHLRRNKRTALKVPTKVLKEESDEDEEDEQPQPQMQHEGEPADDASEDEKDDPNGDNDKAAFSLLPLTQIMCNFTRTLHFAKEHPCTNIGQKIAVNFIRVAATRIFVNPFQSFMELISNAIDAETRNQSTIGRFGMGFFSVFALLLSPKHFDTVLVSTTAMSNEDYPILKTYHLEIVVGSGGLVASLTNHPAEEHTGTSVTLYSSSMTQFEVKMAAMREMVNNFRFVESANIVCNRTNVNQVLAGNIHTVKIETYPNMFRVIDHGLGMTPTQLKSLLTPSVSTKRIKFLPQQEDEEKEIPVRCKLLPFAKPTIVVCVNGVQIKMVQLADGFGSPEHALSLILLPPKTKLPVSRDDVLLLDPETFSNMSQAFEMLLNEHIALKNISQLRILLREYARSSKQPEAYKLIEQVDAKILNCGKVLVPIKHSGGIISICKALHIDYVLSDLISITVLESAILRAAKETNGVTVGRSVFAYNIAISFKELVKPIEKVPNLPNLVFVKPGTPEIIIEQYCQNPRNGCMTVDQFKALSADGLISTLESESFQFPSIWFLHKYDKEANKVHNSINQVWQERKVALFHKDNKAMITNAALLWDARISKLADPPMFSKTVPNLVRQFVDLWLTVEMDMSKFGETLSLFIEKLSNAVVVVDYSGGSFKRQRLQFPSREALSFSRGMLSSINHGGGEVSIMKRKAPIPEMELALLKFKIGIFPNELKRHHFIPQLTDDLHCFRTLVSEFERLKVPQETICVWFDEIWKQSMHVVESFWIVLLTLRFVEAHGFVDQASRLRVIMRIRIELRQQVSLANMVSMYTALLTGHSRVVPLAIGNILNPICGIFPVIAAAMEQSKELSWLQKDRKVFNTWRQVKSPHTEYVFSVNDLIMFVYTKPHIKIAEDFMKPQVLKRLAKFALINGGVCSIQAVLIAANFGTTKQIIASIIAELFQNSTDALKASNLPDEDREIHIGVDTKSLHFKDNVGIKRIMSLLIPFYSEKSADMAANGEMGTGWFNLFRQPLCDHVVIGTKFGDDFIKIVATPLVKGGSVVDVQLKFSIFPNVQVQNGTEICVVFNQTKIEGIDIACQVQLECVSKYYLAPFPLFLNERQINVDKGEEIYAVPGVVSVRGFPNKKGLIVPSLLMIGDIPFGLLSESWSDLMNATTDLRLKANSSHFNQSRDVDCELHLQQDFELNVVVNIDKSQINPVQGRNKLILKNSSQMITHVLQAQRMWMLTRYAAGRLENDFIEHTSDYGDVSQLTFYQGPPFLTSTLHQSWVPNTWVEFFALLDRVITNVINSGNIDQQGVAEQLVAALNVGPVIKNALNFWFRGKYGLPPAPEPPFEPSPTTTTMSAAEVQPIVHVDPIDIIIKTNAFTTLPVANMFIQAFLFAFNKALKAGIMTLTTVQSKATITPIPRIGCVNEDAYFPLDGVWSPFHKILLLGAQYRQMCTEFIAKAKMIPPARFNKTSAVVIKQHFCDNDGSTTLVHETIHCALSDVHASIAHPMLKLTWNQEEHSGLFDTVAVTLLEKLCEQGFNTEFVRLLRENKIISKV